jgi:hypothetical protein
MKDELEESGQIFNAKQWESYFGVRLPAYLLGFCGQSNGELCALTIDAIAPYLSVHSLY